MVSQCKRVDLFLLLPKDVETSARMDQIKNSLYGHDCIVPFFFSLLLPVTDHLFFSLTPDVAKA